MNTARRNPQTANPNESIWADLTEDVFRQHLVSLQEKTGQTPMDSQVFSFEKWLPKITQLNRVYALPLEVEQELADDFAFLAAVEEGAQSVAAVCIEEHIQPPGMALRFAAMDISRNETVETALRGICGLLAQTAASASEGSPPELVTSLFRQIIQLHFYRLLARLRSSKWEKPKYLSKSHKKPLWKDFTNLVHRVQHAYTKKEKATRDLVEGRLKELAAVYEEFEISENQLSSLMKLVDASFTFSSADEIQEYAQRLQNNTRETSQVSSAIKSLRQIQKIASYRRICFSLFNAARQYPALFQQVTINYLVPYQEVSTFIGYHEWATTCHVHAEIQLVVHYDLNRDCRPRCIGTSKWLCYLCYQFLLAHKLFFPSRTHGRIFDQWTVPDLVELSGTLVQEYRRILKEIDGVVLQQIEREPEVRRLQRMTSCDFGEFG
jgi:OTT_1508-like deaminase